MYIIINYVNMTVKNPLGIITLFVTFIDGIAGLVISVNFEHLHGAAERLPLIWFIVTFPVIVLLAFVILVLTKPQNLFGPGDYENQDLYLQAIGKSIRPFKNPAPLKEPENIPVKSNKRGICMMDFSSLKEPQVSHMKVQEAALQRYADEHDMEIKTEVRISRNLICDGVAEKNGQLYLFEVTVNYNPAMADSMKRNLIRIYEAMANKGCEKLHVVLLLVSKEKMTSKAIDDLRNDFVNVIPNVEIMVYINEEINKK